MPTIGCHSTIDSPECVSRVTPPTTTIANTSAQQTSSQIATAWRDVNAPVDPGVLPDEDETEVTAVMREVRRK